MSFCSPLCFISAASALALKARTAKVAADNAISRVLPLLRSKDCIFFLLVRVERKDGMLKTRGELVFRILAETFQILRVCRAHASKLTPPREGATHDLAVVRTLAWPH